MNFDGERLVRMTELAGSADYVGYINKCSLEGGVDIACDMDYLQ